MTEVQAIFRSFSEIEYGPKPSAALKLGSSVFFHVAALTLLILLPRYQPAGTIPPVIRPPDELIFPLRFPPPVWAGAKSGGGGGGGGKRERLPAARGVIPPAAPHQLAAPSVKASQPKEPELDMVLQQTIQAPIQIPRQFLQNYGVLKGLATDSDGTGRGGGIGESIGTGVGTGQGPGAGLGKKGGLGADGEGGVGGQSGPQVSGIGGVTTPQIIRQALPHYTDDAIKARVEGVVVLQIVVKRDGSVDAPRILRALGFGLDEEAIRCVSREWKFKPASRNGQPVDVYAVIEITFRLR